MMSFKLLSNGLKNTYPHMCTWTHIYTYIHMNKYICTCTYLYPWGENDKAKEINN